MSERTEPISHFSILFRAFIFTILVALMSGRIEAKSTINFSGIRSLLKANSSKIAEMNCQQNICNVSDDLLRESHSNSVSLETMRWEISK